MPYFVWDAQGGRTEDLEKQTTGYKGSGSNIDVFRNANMCRLYLKSNGSVSKFYEAYSDGNLSNSFKINIGSYTDGFISKFNNMSGLNRAALSGLTGGDLSGAFDIPLKPYIQSSDYLNFSVNTFLYAKSDFLEEVLKPLNTLLVCVLPESSDAFEGVSEAVAEGVQGVIDMLIPDKWTQQGETGAAFWKAIRGGLENLQSTYVEGIRALSTPIQFNDNNSIILRLGSHRIPNLIITDVNVKWSPVLASQDSKIDITKPVVCPLYAKVDITFKSMNRARPETLNIGGDYNKNALPIKKNFEYDYK